MPLYRNKRGIEESTLAEILLLLLAFVILIGIIKYIGSKAEESGSEKLCRAFNAIRYGTQIDKGPVTFSFAPRVCKTIDKENVPGKDYKEHIGGLKEGAKSELRDLIAKCWWMWLEGNQPNMFSTKTYQVQNKCFVCYTFSLDKKVNSLTIPELLATMENPYEAVDDSDKCAPLGQGGKCMPSCDKSSAFPREVASERCPEGLRCCIAEDLKDECVSKGGVCYHIEGYRQFPKWTCSKGDCYVKNENFASYTDYIQGSKGTGGPGLLAYDDRLEKGLLPEKKYAVTLISPGPGWTWQTTKLAASTAIAGAGTLAATYYAPFFKGTVLATGTSATYSMFSLTGKTGELPGYNFIYISEYEDLRFKCTRELGVDEATVP